MNQFIELSRADTILMAKLGVMFLANTHQLPVSSRRTPAKRLRVIALERVRCLPPSCGELRVHSPEKAGRMVVKLSS